MTTSDKLVILRVQHGYSQDDTAKMLNISKKTYCEYEYGKVPIGDDIVEQLLLFYDIDFNEFSSMHLPVNIKISISNDLLVKLEETIIKNSDIVADWETNKRKLIELRDATAPVLEQKFKYLDLSSLNFDGIETGIDTIVVKLDIRAERLINLSLNMQNRLFDALYQHKHIEII